MFCAGFEAFGTTLKTTSHENPAISLITFRSKENRSLIECAVILAAGTNRRMGPIGCPKALLPLRQSPFGASANATKCATFFSRHVGLLEQKGVERIFVITRECDRAAFEFQASARVEVVTSRFSDLHVGSSLSLLCGLEAAFVRNTGGAGVLVMDADIVYENALLDELWSRCDESRLFVIDRVAGDIEEVRVYGRSPSEPLLIGKGLPPALTENMVLLGESLGVIYLAPSEQEYCAALIRWLAGEPPLRKGFGFSGAQSEHEEIWHYLFCLGRLAAGRLPGSLLYAECDSMDDYAHIRTTVFPAIEAREGV